MHNILINVVKCGILLYVTGLVTEYEPVADSEIPFLTYLCKIKHKLPMELLQIVKK